MPLVSTRIFGTVVARGRCDQSQLQSCHTLIMSLTKPHATTGLTRSIRSSRLRVAGVVLAAGAVLVSTSPSLAAVRSVRPHHQTSLSSKVAYPLGILDRREPSGLAPPGPRAMRGYVLSYRSEFRSRSLPSGWGKFAGVPSGDAGSEWAPSHVRTGGAMARLLTYRDPKFHSNWVSGGMCQCQQGHLYGAFFVRSRVTGPGPDEALLLWPTAPVWPPEVDLNESAYSTHSSSWTVHYGHGNAFEQGTHNFNLERWHTWGVIWTSRSLTFTMDGREWGRVTNYSEIPHQPMTLDIDQQTRCNVPASWAACPRHEATLQVNWVEEYRPAG
jgi:hypothetical protein